jgi:omega-6 fatty acid desaturase (delta-12 desaturase)
MTGPRVRTGPELLRATVPFAVESLEKSWWYVGSTFVLLGAALAGAGLAPWWPLRLCLSIVAAMLMVRAFITYHDYMHGTILARSRLAWLLFRAYAGLALTPTIIITAMSDRCPAPASAPFR